ncbi:amidohydrolase family protein [Microbacterium betulae]|uniref:Amidohydrolase family protein n=1 Tax=Microbacterium betulae TaxID=2981139 RepID=A0AA97FIN7_9MICO|nr:amidohydrolase family protein [Microbacterium sp. AB]WOF23906.1 amidohydrolase family protein [Microbacterium sp. AB]
MHISAPTRLRGATLADGSVVDVTLVDDRVTRIEPAAGDALGPAEIDLSEHLLLTAPADPHAHLDKALSWDAIRPPSGDLRTAIAAWRSYVATINSAEISSRATRAVQAYLVNGTTAIRTHADVPAEGDPVRAVRALAEVRERFAGRVRLEIVALAGPDTTDDRIDAALDAGADLVGGAPHLADDQLADLHRLLDIAQRRGVGADLHVDEDLRHGETLEAYAERTRDWSVVRSAGHCVRLSTLPAPRFDHVARAVADAGIGVIANPMTNLWLQGWDEPVATPRGIAPLDRLRRAGVRTAAGGDNVRDPFNPLGRADAFETAMLLVVAGHLPIDDAWRAVSDDARTVMALPEAGPRVGAVAELLAVRAASLPEAMATAPADRIVFSRGRVVARSTTTRWIDSGAGKEDTA